MGGFIPGIWAIGMKKDSFEEIKTYLKERLACYKIPALVGFVDDFPRNPTGRVLKKELRRMAQEKGGNVI